MMKFMETNMANKETIGENGNILPQSEQCEEAKYQGAENNEFLEEPRDDEDNPGALFSPSTGGPSYEQTGQLKTGPSCETNANDNDYFDDSRRLSFLGPVVCLIVAIVVVWVMRLFLPLIQAFAGSSGGQKALYGCMLALPALAIAVAIVWAIRVFRFLPAGVDYRYSPGYNEKRALREKLIRKYLNGFKRDNNLGRRIGKDAQAKLELLCQGSNNDIDDWFNDYKEFQNALKSMAEKERDKYARAIAVATMASSKFQLDVTTTLFFSTLMLISIARIFNKRTTRIGAFRLACSWSLNLFLSSQLQGWAKKIASVIGAGVNIAVTSATNVPKAGEITGRAVSKVTGVLIEGGINKHMAKLLGDKAIKYFAAVKGLENIGGHLELPKASPEVGDED